MANRRRTIAVGIERSNSRICLLPGNRETRRRTIIKYGGSDGQARWKSCSDNRCGERDGPRDRDPVCAGAALVRLERGSIASLARLDRYFDAQPTLSAYISRFTQAG